MYAFSVLNSNGFPVVFRLTYANMCTLTDVSALAAAGGSPSAGSPSRLVMRLAPIDVKFSPVEMSLLMQLSGEDLTFSPRSFLR
jgi:hypothetical protein